MLTQEEKLAGRFWREQCQDALRALNILEIPDVVVPLFAGRFFRHECPARGGRSTSFEVKEVYRPNPELTDLPEGRLAWIYREGRCGCGLTARSADGRVVDAHVRAPLRR